MTLSTDNIRLIEELLEKKETFKAIKEAEKIQNQDNVVQLGYLFKKYGIWNQAVNFFNKELYYSENNQVIKNEVAYLLQILETDQLDIFASTNLNKDPWFE